MAEELLINVTPMECRVALIENGTVNELLCRIVTGKPKIGRAHV